MITEDYVSFEVAKLLKEKGMNKSCFNHYVQKNNNDGTSEAVAVCTLQMAMKWLREVHNLCIEPYYVYDGYLCTISKIPTGVEVYYSNEGGDKDSGRFATFEQACESAIKYSLKNLI